MPASGNPRLQFSPSMGELSLLRGHDRLQLLIIPRCPGTPREPLMAMTSSIHWATSFKNLETLVLRSGAAISSLIPALELGTQEESRSLLRLFWTPVIRQIWMQFSKQIWDQQPQWLAMDPCSFPPLSLFWTWVSAPLDNGLPWTMDLGNLLPHHLLPCSARPAAPSRLAAAWQPVFFCQVGGKPAPCLPPP